MFSRGKNESGRTVSVPTKANKKRPEIATNAESSSWLAKRSVEQRIDIHGVTITIDRVLLASRSSRVANILTRNPDEDLSCALRDMPGDWQTFEQVGRFCHGFEPVLTAVNAIPLFCLAHFLGMTNAHSPGNLLPRVSSFIRDKVLPSWNESVVALRASETLVQAAAELGLIDALIESIVSKAMSDPQLLLEPLEIREAETVRYAQPFHQESQREDLTMLSLQFYEPIMLGMIHNKVPSCYIASSLIEYINKRVMPYISTTHIASRIQARGALEAVERMLPEERGLIPCNLLFQMLMSATTLDASSACREALELRIGKNLDQATVADLLIPSHGYAKQSRYDVESVKRILKAFYTSFADAPDVPDQPKQVTGLIRVAELMENFLAQVASDIDVKLETFTQLAVLSAAASSGSHRPSDGIYRAIDIFLDKHGYLTEAERDKVCQALDCHSMSAAATEHAKQNDRLPLRVVVQAMFAEQLKVRNAIAREVMGVPESGELEIGKMESKVMDLERECSMIRREIEIGRGREREEELKKKKKSGRVWKEMKRKFGCMSSHDSNCHVIKKKKIHPK